MTTHDKILGSLLLASITLTIYGFFGVTGFAVIGTIVAVIAIIAFLGWVNYLTGGALAAALLFWSV